ncbi:hypothetical protein LSH36_576g03104 [Paralvinella palmiformis]|uniref:Uncharacterized protein n=1 Tax=Paralvinella palmiformis TaxID=53620 RepID=A0AAD9MV56_9ANNE|nr:hypothetical protein LSH36_576g03104 [Paralvinella palmiformis]
MKVRRLTRRLLAFVIVIGLYNFVVVVQRYPASCSSDDVDENGLIGRRLSTPGIPYVYPDEVDLRIIVITFNRGASLETLLLSLDHLELDGDKASLEIWIDRDPLSEAVDCATLAVARDFVWSLGKKHVYAQRTHVGIYGQWIDTWRPQPGTRELALILEDDLTVSPYAYRWLKAVHRKYGSRKDVAGYTLQSEDVNLATGVGRWYSLTGPAADMAFMYKRIGTWGYAPHPEVWRRFQDWFHAVRTKPDFRPYVDKASIITKWYRDLEVQGRESSMWSMWHVYYSDQMALFTIYNNLQTSAPGDHVALVENRKELGLHFQGPFLRWLRRSKLMTSWSDGYVDVPDFPVRYDWDGTVL